MVADEFDEQTRDNSAFDWLPKSSAVSRLGSDGCTDNYLILIMYEKLFMNYSMEGKIYSG